MKAKYYVYRNLRTKEAVHTADVVICKSNKKEK